MVSYPSDELAERRARRDGRNVVFLDGPRGEAVEARLEAARHDVAVLQARVGATVAERDRMAAVAAARRDQLDAAGEREAAEGTVAVRRRGTREQVDMKFDEFVALIEKAAPPVHAGTIGPATSPHPEQTAAAPTLQYGMATKAEASPAFKELVKP